MKTQRSTMWTQTGLDTKSNISLSLILYGVVDTQKSVSRGVSGTCLRDPVGQVGVRQ